MHIIWHGTNSGPSLSLISQLISSKINIVRKLPDRYSTYSAAWQGARIIFEQVSPEANGIFDFIMAIHRSCNGDWHALAEKLSISGPQIEGFVQYAASFLSNVGNFYVSTGTFSYTRSYLIPSLPSLNS